jgi:hypothetical protein
VEVTGLYEGTPLIRFMQKGKGVVSFTGEKLYETQVVAAVETALSGRRGHYEFITAVGEMRGDHPQYSFLIEFDAAVPANEAERLLHSIETALCEQNAEYAAKRASGRIQPPTIQDGKRDSQFKTVRLTSDAASTKSFAVASEVRLATP